MLTIKSNYSGSSCDGHSRRDFLRLGALGLGGLTLPWLLQQRASAESYFRDRSVVFLFLCGGPSHIETFDPNMTAPAPRHSLTGEVKTSLPGVTFGGTFPRLAAQADRLAIVRSYSPHDIADHARAIRHTFTGGDALGSGSSLGAMVARLRGGSNPSSGMPTFATLIEQEVDPQYMEDMDRMRASNAPGELGAACAPFDPRGGSQLLDNMQLHLPLERLEDRRQLVSQLDQLGRRLDQSDALAGMDRLQQQAVELLTGQAAREALDLSKEDPRLVARYDTSSFNVGYLKKRPSTLGQRLLLARRLCEAGCGFVTVGSAGWDNHGNGKHPGVKEGMEILGRPLDQAVSTFLDDVRDRGLSDKILLVITGEFGRTPTIEKEGGRNHWPGMCPLVFAGGGLRMGQVIGRMARSADIPATEPIRLGSLVASVMHAFFDVGQLRLDSGAPRNILSVLERNKPIEALF